MKSRLAAAALLCIVFAMSSSAAIAAEAAKDTKKATPINKICPVGDGEVDPGVTVEHDGKTIGFCCAGCDEDFKKDPPKYMAIVAKELKEGAAKDAKDKGKKKDEGKEKEKKLNTKCPVTGDDADKSLTTTHKGRTIAFCCADCVKDFEKDPKKYLAKLDEAEKAEKKKEKDKEKDKNDGKKEQAEK